MPIPFLIPALFTIGTALAQGGMQMYDNNKNREEARRLADIARNDTLKQQRINNDFTRKQQNLNQQQLDFSRSLSTLDMREKDRQKSFLEGTTQTDFMKSRAKGIFGDYGATSRRLV